MSVVARPPKDMRSLAALGRTRRASASPPISAISAIDSVGGKTMASKALVFNAMLLSRFASVGIVLILASCTEPRVGFTVEFGELDQAAISCPGGLTAVITCQPGGGGDLPKFYISQLMTSPSFTGEILIEERALTNSLIDIWSDCKDMDGGLFGHAQYHYTAKATLGTVRIYAPGVDPAKIIPSASACSEGLWGNSGDPPCAAADHDGGP